MAKERLSKLQKWILIQAYENKKKVEIVSGHPNISKEHIQKMLERFEELHNGYSYAISNWEIYQNYFSLKFCNKSKNGRLINAWKFAEPPGSKPVILARSLRLLKNRGYIRRYGSGNAIGLTKKGISRAKELLKV